MNQQVLFERCEGTTTEQRTSVYPQGNDSVFARIPHSDLLTFLALAQTMPDLAFYHTIPRYGFGNSRRGASGAVHTGSTEPLAYKRFHVTHDFSLDLAYKALICELLVLEHPVLKNNPCIQDIKGVCWDVQSLEGVPYRVMPVLVFKRAEHGSLMDYLSPEIPLPQRLSLCSDIGKAIESMHSLGKNPFYPEEGLKAYLGDAEIVHGDIKPDNILVFTEDGGVRAKVNDFGFSCFGSSPGDKVYLYRTLGWAAPEIRDTTMTVEDAKKTDIYSFGKVCAWMILGWETQHSDFLSSEIRTCLSLNRGKARWTSFWQGNPNLEDEFFISLRCFLEQACHEEADERASIVQLLHRMKALVQLCQSV